MDSHRSCLIEIKGTVAFLQTLNAADLADPGDLGIPIGLITAEVLDREIKESPYLGGQIFSLGKNCIENMVGNMIGPQDPD